MTKNLKNIWQSFKNFLAFRHYKKYRKKRCPKCERLNWKYCFAPYFIDGEKATLVARTCGNCSWKDPIGFVIKDSLKLSKNLTLKV